MASEQKIWWEEEDQEIGEEGLYQDVQFEEVAFTCL